jgi:hypothetical protein
LLCREAFVANETPVFMNKPPPHVFKPVSFILPLCTCC